MKTIININERGTLTLPKELRKRLGLQASGQIVAEDTAEGILLRAGVTFPIEIYDAKRIAEFQEKDAELAPFVDRLRKKPRSGKR